MAKHPHDPVEGEFWRDPETERLFLVHAITDDKWVRYSWAGGASSEIYTRPVMDFVRLYVKVG